MKKKELNSHRTTFSFQAVTKSGVVLELFASLKKDGTIQYGGKNISTSYEHPNVGSFVKKTEGWCIRLDNEYINESLIGKKMTGLVLINDYNEQEVINVQTHLNRLQKEKLQAEINSLTDDDRVTLRQCLTGYGSSYSLANIKLSYEASELFAATVKTIHKNKWAVFTSAEMDSSFYEVEMPYAEFKNLAERVIEYNAEQQRKKEEQEKMQEQERKDIEENELFIFDAGVIYSSAGNKMLHSLGAILSEKDNKISIYTTTYSKDIPNSNTTFTIKEQLNKEGFKYNAETKSWDIDLTDDNAQKAIALLKKYDTKVWPEDSGMVRCWECGSYFKPKKGDYDGVNYYCGC